IGIVGTLNCLAPMGGEVGIPGKGVIGSTGKGVAATPAEGVAGIWGMGVIGSTGKGVAATLNWRTPLSGYEPDAGWWPFCFICSAGCTASRGVKGALNCDALLDEYISGEYSLCFSSSAVCAYCAVASNSWKLVSMFRPIFLSL